MLHKTHNSYSYVQKSLSSGDSSSCLVFAMVDSFGFFPLSGIRFTSLYMCDFFLVFMAMVCSHRGMCLVAPAVPRLGVLLSSNRRGGCTPRSRPGSGSICVDDERLRYVAVSSTVDMCSFVVETPVSVSFSTIVCFGPGTSMFCAKPVRSGLMGVYLLSLPSIVAYSGV